MMETCGHVEAFSFMYVKLFLSAHKDVNRSASFQGAAFCVADVLAFWILAYCENYHAWLCHCAHLLYYTVKMILPEVFQHTFTILPVGTEVNLKHAYYGFHKSHCLVRLSRFNTCM